MIHDDKEVYVATYACGKWVAVTAIDHGDTSDTESCVEAWLRNGWAVQMMELGEFRALDMICDRCSKGVVCVPEEPGLFSGEDA